MRYQGGKHRTAKELIPIITKNRRPDQVYVEPFCGGLNTVIQVSNPRIANDFHSDLIAMYKKLQQGWVPPMYINEDEYRHIEKFGEPHLKGFVGHAFSFGAKYFGTFARGIRGRKENWKGHYESITLRGKESWGGVMKMVPLIEGVAFHNVSYEQLRIPPRSLIYCDPPYKGTVGYGNSFNHNLFYDWCRLQKAKGHDIFISEYQMPKDFKCVWSKTIQVSSTVHGKGKATEKLFTL
jgi:DNA adenine methylase